MLTEVVGQEEVTVFLIVGDVNLKGRQLHATLRRHTLRRRILLREDGLQLQLAKLHVGAQTEQTAGTLHQRVVRGERHVTALHQFDDFVLLALVAQLQVLRVEVEGGIGVVVQRHIDLVAYLTRHVQVDLLVEVHRCRLTVTLRQRRIVDVLHRRTQLQLGRSLRLDTHTTGTENLLSRTQVEVHIGKREFLLALLRHVLSILLAEEQFTLPALAPGIILFGSHQDWRIQVRVAHLRTHAVHVQRVVILHLLLDILRETQVQRRRVQVGHLHRCRLLNLPTRLDERIGFFIPILK